MAPATVSVPVLLEIGARRVFASAVDWPGWCRWGKDEQGALAALAAAAPRYALVTAEARAVLPTNVAGIMEVVERLPGSTTTDFGVPGAIGGADARPLTRDGASRLAALVSASWTVFDRIVAAAPAELRKGPRGGGRDRDKIVDHVLGGEVGYSGKIGLRLSQPARDDPTAVAGLRTAITEVLRQPSDGTPVVPRGWPAWYAARRIAWHVLDHGWEIEDRSGPL